MCETRCAGCLHTVAMVTFMFNNVPFRFISILFIPSFYMSILF